MQRFRGLTQAFVIVPTPHCWGVAARLLPTLSTLRRLRISPLSHQSFQVKPWFLPCVAELTQLTSLAIERWKTPIDQYHNIRRLLQLKNLQVSHLSARS